jgi:hypothetical protein
MSITALLGIILIVWSLSHAKATQEEGYTTPRGTYFLP